MPIAGGLISESLRIGSVLEGVPLTVTRIWRADVGDVDAGQPLAWTFLDFEADDECAEPLAALLSDVLDPTCGWYCDFRNADTTFVVYSGQIFRYPRGDRTGRVAAEDHGRAVGVPESQLDWPE
jgi:hypothetical protein